MKPKPKKKTKSKKKISRKSAPNKLVQSTTKDFIAKHFPIKFEGPVRSFTGFDMLPQAPCRPKSIIAKLMEAYELHRARHSYMPETIYLNDKDYDEYVSALGEVSKNPPSLTFRGTVVRRSVFALFIS